MHYQWMLEGVSKFRFFFAGLVFAIDGGRRVLIILLNVGVPEGKRGT